MDDFTFKRAIGNAFESGQLQEQERIVDLIQKDQILNAWFTPQEVKHLVALIEGSHE